MIYGDVQRFMKSWTSWVFLSIVYVVGIGLTALVARASGKRFLPPDTGASMWVKHKKTSTPGSMF